MLDIKEIPLGPFMKKWHFQQPGIPAMHRIVADPNGPPHDHPFAMTSIILYGGYIEEVFDLDGLSHLVEHSRDDSAPKRGEPCSSSFLIPAKHIHRIVKTINDEPCWTITMPHEWEQHEGIFQFGDDGAYKRAFNSNEWVKVS